jgi:selenide, water dikinase
MEDVKSTATEKVRLTQFSHGAGCGCKIAPGVLDIILKNNETGII